MTDSTGSSEDEDTTPDPLASTQFFDTTSEFGDDEGTVSSEPTTVQEPDPTTVEDVPAPPVPPPPPPPPLSGPAAAVAPAGPAGPDRPPSRLPLVLSLVAAALLVGIGVMAFVLITADGDDDIDQPEAAATTAAPPDGVGDAAVDEGDEGDEADEADEDDAAAEAEAAAAFADFVDTRGTDDERQFSSEGGREELDAIVAQVGDIDLQGDPVCTAQGDGTVDCVQDTDEGEITFTFGEDEDSPGGLEMIGARLG